MEQMYPVAILAGGLATRLRPITETVPKALVDVCGKPFIVWQLEYLRSQGVSEVVLCVGYLGEMILDLVGCGQTYGLKVSYSFDGPELLGTGGALKKAMPLLGDRFFVLYGDSYLPIQFSKVQEAYIRNGQPGLMTILKNANQWDLSNVEFVNGRIVEYNKRILRPEMTYIDYGLGLLAASVFAIYSTNSPFDLADIYQDLSVKGQLAGFEVNHRFFEIGTLAGLKDMNEYLQTKERT